MEQDRPSVSTVHKAVRNFLVNELGISHDKVMKEVEPLVRAAVAELMGMNFNTTGIGKKWVHDLIRDVVKEMIKTEVSAQILRTLAKHTKVNVEIMVPAP